MGTAVSLGTLASTSGMPGSAVMRLTQWPRRDGVNLPFLIVSATDASILALRLRQRRSFGPRRRRGAVQRGWGKACGDVWYCWPRRPPPNFRAEPQTNHLRGVNAAG